MNTQKIIQYLCCFVAVLMINIVLKGQSYSRYSPEFTPFSQFYFQPSFYNPAYIANEYSPTYWFSVRNQSTSQPTQNTGDTNRSINATYQVGMDKLPVNWAVIMSYQNLRTSGGNDPTVSQITSYRRFTSFQGGLQANFDFDVGDKGTGKVGLGGSMLYFDNQLGNDSIAIANNGIQKWYPVMDIGVLLSYDRFHFGISTTNTTQLNLGQNNNNGQNGGTPGTTGTNNTQASPFQGAAYLNALYRINLTETFMIEPHFLLRQYTRVGGGGANGTQSDFSAISMDLAVILNYYNFVFLGYSYKPPVSRSPRYINYNYGGSIMAGIRFNETYHFSFSWDLRRKNINENTTQFEIGIGAYLFGEYLYTQ